MVDAASGGALIKKTSHKARNLIATLVAKSQQFCIRSNPKGKVNDLSTSPTLEVQVNK